MYEILKTGIHYEPLRPGRALGTEDKYEFTHGTDSVCVYDAKTMDFVKEIKVGERPDCHATSVDNSYLYIACREGIYCISQDTLEVEKILNIGMCYATNILPDGNTLLVHDLSGGIVLIKDITDMNKIREYKRVQVVPNGKFRCEIGGKGNFIENGRYYLCNGWEQSEMYLFDMENDFSYINFIEKCPELYRSDDLVISKDKTKAYSGCHLGNYGNSRIVVIDIASRKIIKAITTGVGTCGLTMSNDERYVIASNDQDDSITVIDTVTDEVVNTPCAKEGFDALGIRGYIQGISCAADDSIFVYGCAGNGALVRFYDVAKSNKYVISTKDGKFFSE